MNVARRRQGTASVEIVIMLPVFIALFFAVTYLHGLGSASQSAAVAVRSCAWAYALEGCQGHLDAGCTELGLGKPEGFQLSVPGNEVELKPDGETQFSGGWFDAIDDVPILGAAARSVFGQGKRIQATRVTAGYMSGSEEVVSRSVYVLCNTTAESWSKKISDLFPRITDCDPNKDALCKD